MIAAPVFCLHAAALRCSLQADRCGGVASRRRTAPRPRHCARRHLSKVRFSLVTSKLAHQWGRLFQRNFSFLSSRKDKNDLNKIIFKSGDLQMSPYADFPKSNRTSMEWGRETIEMQENGSTKNLLQMSDIYYSVRRAFVLSFEKKKKICSQTRTNTKHLKNNTQCI